MEKLLLYIIHQFKLCKIHQTKSLLHPKPSLKSTKQIIPRLNTSSKPTTQTLDNRPPLLTQIQWTIIFGSSLITYPSSFSPMTPTHPTSLSSSPLPRRSLLLTRVAANTNLSPRTVDSSALIPAIVALARTILILNVIHVLLEAHNDR
jgi:hypothetical protein